MPCRTLLIAVLLTLATPVWAGGGGAFVYDARMAFLKAGELALSLNRFGQEYEVAGAFQTSRAMSTYYTWNGVFAATGIWHMNGPVTRAYLARSSSKDDDLKIVLNTEDGARLLDSPDGDFETIEKPDGVDLISALFFNPTCYQGETVHDGEDAYRLKLRSTRSRTMKSASGYYQGEVVDCDYEVRDHKDRKRRVIVSLADVGDTTVAVQLRAKIPVLPDAIFKLRMPPVLQPTPAVFAAQ